jgi:hypothetical protein
LAHDRGHSFSGFSQGHAFWALVLPNCVVLHFKAADLPFLPSFVPPQKRTHHAYFNIARLCASLLTNFKADENDSSRKGS